MACVENIPPQNDDSEMEEGEIVDDLDDLSDISSEEEFLLRQRLQVLENYNNVLERKKAKNPTYGSGKRKEESFLNDLSEISATELDENFPHVTSKANVIVYRDVKDQRNLKSYHKQKKKKDIDPYNVGRAKDYKKKVHRKKRLEVKVISESSEESDDEYRNKRRKLENAVTLHKGKNDKSSLQDRLQKMLCKKPLELPKPVATEDKQTETEVVPKHEDVSCSPIILKPDLPNIELELHDKGVSESQVNNAQNVYESIDLCTDDDVSFTKVHQSVDAVDSVTNKQHEIELEKEVESDSDEDLEMLRQHALQTKVSKTKTDQIVPTEPEKPLLMSEDEDSDTAELRLICLKSALLKKAIEMKQKQKLRKRLSQSSNLHDDFLHEKDELMDKIESENNTDIEAMDMDIGSDGDEKSNICSDNVKEMVSEKSTGAFVERMNSMKERSQLKEDELEEDEDLLRARLLTSLSKNLPNLVDPSVINTIEQETKPESTPPAAPKTQQPENRIIINLGESDSEGEEHEATKNLTKMHAKLSEQIDFQQKLDMFLKSTRMEVEGQKLPDVVQNPVAKPKEKFVAKTVNHLPKSEQIEYKNLVKRMAELEKIKQARQSSMILAKQLQAKDTLKPRNVSLDTTKIIAINKLEEQIALSRKTIAEESAKMMKLKEESTKLSQKYKIVATELKNIATAITLNKKEQRCVQNKLAKIRIQHQRLLNSSTNKHSKSNGNILTVNRPSNRVMSTAKLQKENNPEDNKTSEIFKTIQVNVVNDKFQNDILGPHVKLCVKLDLNRSNQKHTERIVDVVKQCDANDDAENLKEGDVSRPVVEKGGGRRGSDATSTTEQKNDRRKELDDYESPLQAFDSVK
uniref:Uncharacterized protein n=2 Tax=Pectinophora gossypiella TaxID=13191 RepID=A0A1E1W1P7_PECGO